MFSAARRSAWPWRAAAPDRFFPGLRFQLGHPRLRVYIMHAGFPLLDDLLALLYAHPQGYVEVGVILFTQPRAAFYRYLRGIVEAGFGNRVMFGSDQMVWPGVIERSHRRD